MLDSVDLDPIDDDQNYSEHLIAPLPKPKISLKEAFHAGICCINPPSTNNGDTFCIACLTWTPICLGAGTGIAFAVNSVTVGTVFAALAGVDAALTTCFCCNIIKC